MPHPFWWGRGGDLPLKGEWGVRLESSPALHGASIGVCSGETLTYTRRLDHFFVAELILAEARAPFRSMKLRLLAASGALSPRFVGGMWFE